MERSTDWQRFEHPEFQIRFAYPTETPGGRTVERTDHRREDATGIHLTTADKQELYFEVVRFRDLTPQEEYAGHTPHLEQRFGAGSTSQLMETTYGGRPAWTYDFRRGERTALLLPVGGDTYRIIYDPRFPLNLKVLDTITIVE